MTDGSHSNQLFPLSVVVLTKNEEDRLGDCLSSCSWVDDIVVVDSGSRDKTIEIAKSYGAHVVHQGWLGFGKQRRFAVAQAAHDWVLCLDADERLTEELSESIRAELSGNPRHIYRIPRRSFFMGRFLRHGACYPDWQVRLFDRRHANWNEDPVEEKVISEDSPAPIRGDILHFPSVDLKSHLEKQIRFANIRANYLYRQCGYTPGSLHILTRPVLRFLKNYFLRRGFLDGIPGLIHTICCSVNCFVKYARITELQRMDKKKQP